MILAGEVRLGDRIASKSSEPVSEEHAITVEPRSARYASRGGEKLAGALDVFALDVRGAVAVDVGASTGGFTDCLLQCGAARVYAIDVGRGQLAWSLRSDPRVVALERRNIRHLEPGTIAETCDLATVDVSFISLELVLPKVVTLVRPRGSIVALVKPQFEVGRGQVGKGGVVRDPALHLAAVDRVRKAAAALDLAERGFVESSLLGPAGNREFFLWFARN